MSKQEQAGLILKLYELRREETMRKARDWYLYDFHPASIADVNQALVGEHGSHLRMIASYWDMAAALVNHHAIDLHLFSDTNGEHFIFFAKLEPFLAEVRAAHGPQICAHLETLIDAMPNGRERTAALRKNMQTFREAMVAKEAASATLA
jgi:hypothetical protein